MKKIYFLLIFLLAVASLRGQNVFPSTGNVGIGTSSPQAGLHVNRGVSITGTNTLTGVNGFSNLLEFVNPYHAAIVYNPGQTSQLMFGFHSNGSMFWGSNTSYTMSLTKSGNLRVYNALTVGGSLKSGSKLSVHGKISAQEVEVTTSNWPDYVFDEGYDLLPSDSLRNYIVRYRHLPEIPTAAEVEENGVQLGEMVNKLLKKNEELTLYILQQQKSIDLLTEKLNRIEEKL